MSLLTPAGDQLVVRGGNAHFFTYTRIRSRETGENKTDEQTRTKLGVNQEQRKVCNTTCMCRLSLAWVTSENSTMLLESDSSWLTLAGPYPMLPRLSAPMSGVDRPCPWIHANLCCSPLCCPPANCSLLSSRQLPSLLSSRQLPSPRSRRQLSFASPYHFRIRRDFMSKNPLSGFAPKQTRLLWRPTHIVLQYFRIYLT